MSVQETGSVQLLPLIISNATSRYESVEKVYENIGCDFQPLRRAVCCKNSTNTVHPPICQFFISRKSVDKSGFVDKSGES